MTGQRGSQKGSHKGSRTSGVDKIREILLHLQKVDAVVHEVRSKLNELEEWKQKLEQSIYTYLNENSPMNLGVNVNQNGFPNNNNPYNNYNDFNNELLGLTGVTSQNASNRSNGWRIPNVPSTSGLLTSGGHFPDAQNNNNANSNVTNSNETPPSKPPKERAATLKIIRTKIQQVYDSEEGKQKYKCTDCLKTFDKWPNASKHIRLIHLREQRHKCPVCARDFYDKRSALAHQNNCNPEFADRRASSANLQICKEPI